jgi:hypothetical protein
VFGTDTFGCLPFAGDAGADYPITAVAGTYTITGTDITAPRAYVLKAAPELLDNGEFTSGTASWSPTVSSSLSEAGGTLTVTKSVNDANWVGFANSTGFTVTAGMKYELSWTGYVPTSLGGIHLMVGTFAGGGDIVGLTAGASPNGSLTFTPSSSGTAYVTVLGAYLGSFPASFAIDSVSLRETPAYVITGTDAGLFKGQMLTADPGTYSITGTATSFLVNRVIAATPGSYSITGTTTGLLVGRLITATPGSYSITGTAAGLLKGYSVTATPGSYAITGTAAGLVRTWIMPVTPGSYSITGTAAGLLRQLLITATPGSYSITGTDATLTKGGGAVSLAVDPGSYAITGTAVSLTRTYALAVDPGSYSITGEPASLLYSRVVVGAPGSYTITGTPVTFTIGAALPASPWTVEPDPGTVSLGEEADPELADQTAGFFSSSMFDPLYYETDGPTWDGDTEGDGSTPITVEPDPELATASGAPFNSLFYDPAFYVTNVQTWTPDSEPQRVAILEET